jgi:CHRD domain-containing protein
MKKVLFAAVLLVVGMLPVGATASAEATGKTTRFVAHLNAAQEAQTPAVVSKASGTGTFRTTDNDTKIHFRLSSRGLDRITQAHIHLAPKGVNGAIVLFLFPVGPGVSGEGWSVSGTVTAADVVAPATGTAPTFAEIIAAIRAGNAYANIHTKAYPAGEIRGQLLPGGEGD